MKSPVEEQAGQQREFSVTTGQYPIAMVGPFC
jgi:hypothetical protein